ncbi:hypothetical protein [Streptomyces puniciscabiei]|nr:hypothetical protein [Streptomyces puniciscabiei]
MDEKPFQLLDHVRGPLPARPGHDACQDSEYISGVARAPSS